MNPIRVAILTVSDRSFLGQREDLSGPGLAGALPGDVYTVTVQAILPDERNHISSALRDVADNDRADVILTTGGTGVTPRDVTPEATREVIEREIPGIAEWMRIAGRAQTKFSVLSRAVVGNRGKVLIVNLPGSPSGAVESLGAILDLVPHVLKQLVGVADHEKPPSE